MFHTQALILDNKEIAPGYFLMEVASPQFAKNSLPGQFLHVRCSPTCRSKVNFATTNQSPLLRRPFSIHRVIGKDAIEILYKVVGKGTECLSKRKKGERIDCLGPLGNGFCLPITDHLHPPCFLWKTKKGGEQPITEFLLVAGGIGIAPLFFLAETLTKTENQKPITIFIGAKTKDEILCVKKLKNLGVKIRIATEDGSLGYKGLVSNLLKNHLSSVVYACGPTGMLKAIALLSKEHQIPCQVSFEQFMGCGIGICNSCVIKTKHGYKRVCKDGPVFNAEEIDWERI